MRQNGFVVYLAIGMLVGSGGFMGAADAHEFYLTPPERMADGSVSVRIEGNSPDPVVLQGSADMRTWQDLQSYVLRGRSMIYTDPKGSQTRIRYFRLKADVASASLPELSESPNEVFPAGEGTDSIQFAADGTLGFIFWKGRNLRIRERRGQNWVEQTITGDGSEYRANATRTDYIFQPAAVLLYDSTSQPHVFKLNGNATITRYRRAGASWSPVEVIANPAANNSLRLLVGAMGPNDTFHLACVSGGDNPNLTHGVKGSGQWRWSTVSANITALPRNYLAPSYATRWFSMAVDSKNAAHVAFRQKYQLSFNGQYPRAYNELAYASNSGGHWTIQVVQSPRDASGEAGNGASIAMGPDDKPCIASWYNERADTGSAQWSRLHFHSRDNSGKWNSSIVASRPDGYMAGDGEKGTGFAPQLRFDAQGRANIVFSDHAAEHFWLSGQSEYAGQIRHARLSGGVWQMQTIYRQSDPTKLQMIYPAFALHGKELAVIGLERGTKWNMSVYPPVVTSSIYRFVTVVKSL